MLEGVDRGLKLAHGVEDLALEVQGDRQRQRVVVCLVPVDFSARERERLREIAYRTQRGGELDRRCGMSLFPCRRLAVVIGPSRRPGGERVLTHPALETAQGDFEAHARERIR